MADKPRFKENLIAFRDSLTVDKLKMYQKSLVIFMVIWIIGFGYLKYMKIAMIGMVVSLIFFAITLFLQKQYFPESEVGLSFGGSAKPLEATHKPQDSHTIKDSSKPIEEPVSSKQEETKLEEEDTGFLGLGSTSFLPSAEDLGLPDGEEFSRRAKEGLGI